MPDEAFTELATARLRLRRFRPGDLDVFAAYRSDSLVARYQGWEAPYSRADAERFLNGIRASHPDTPGEWFQFAIGLPDGTLLGDCGVGVDLDDPHQAEIGFTLARQHQGQGYATEAVRRLLDYLLRDRGKHRVRARCDTRNLASAAVLERCGMRREAHLRQSTWVKGEWTDDFLYAVLADDWPGAFPEAPRLREV